MSIRPTRRTLLAAGAALTVLSLAACGGSSSSSSSSASASGSASGSGIPAVEKDATLAALVPSAVASSGKVVVGTDASYAPSEFIDTDGQTVIGFDVDLGKAMAQVLGLQADFQNAPFDSILPGLTSGKFQLGISSFTVNPEREKVVDMVSYYQAGTAWAVAKGNPSGITQDNACGKKVAVQKATVQVDDIEAKSKACTDAGKSAIDIQQFQAQSDATTALASGRVDAMLADSPVVAYAIQQTGTLEQLGDVYDAAPYGAAVPKTDPNFAKAVQGAYQKLIDTGVYKAILDKWGVGSGAIAKAEINPVK